MDIITLEKLLTLKKNNIAANAQITTLENVIEKQLGSRNKTLYIPLYYPVYVDEALNPCWAQINEVAQNNPEITFYVILSEGAGWYIPFSGSADYSKWVEAIAQMDASNIKLLGYMYIYYSSLSILNAKTLIDNYFTDYPMIDGIFLDGVWNQETKTGEITEVLTQLTFKGPPVAYSSHYVGDRLYVDDEYREITGSNSETQVIEIGTAFSETLEVGDIYFLSQYVATVDGYTNKDINAYYNELQSYIKSKKETVWLVSNPGSSINESLLEYSDKWVVFEGILEPSVYEATLGYGSLQKYNIGSYCPAIFCGQYIDHREVDRNKLICLRWGVEEFTEEDFLFLYMNYGSVFVTNNSTNNWDSGVFDHLNNIIQWMYKYDNWIEGIRINTSLLPKKIAEAEVELISHEERISGIESRETDKLSLVHNAEEGNELSIINSLISSMKLSGLMEKSETGEAGGMVFFRSGGVVYECAPDNWYGESGDPLSVFSDVVDVLAGTSYETGTGESNTLAIIGQTGHTESAANLCNQYSVNGFDDWFLPSADELQLLYDKVITELESNSFYGAYWSSTEGDAYWGRGHSFDSSDYKGGWIKTDELYVRPIRKYTYELADEKIKELILTDSYTISSATYDGENNITQANIVFTNETSASIENVTETDELISMDYVIGELTYRFEADKDENGNIVSTSLDIVT